MRKKTLSDRSVAALKPRARRYSVPDPGQLGLYVRVQPTGAKSFAAVTPDPHGRQIWATLGTTDVLKLETARAKAREAIRRVKDGLPPFEEPSPRACFRTWQRWLKRHVGRRARTEVRHPPDAGLACYRSGVGRPLSQSGAATWRNCWTRSRSQRRPSSRRSSQPDPLDRELVRKPTTVAFRLSSRNAPQFHGRAGAVARSSMMMN